MFMINYKELSWWYWLVTACLLTAEFFVVDHKHKMPPLVSITHIT